METQVLGRCGTPLRSEEDGFLCGPGSSSQENRHPSALISHDPDHKFHQQFHSNSNMLPDPFYSPSLSEFSSTSPATAELHLPKQIVTERQVVADLIRVMLSIPSQILVKKAYSDQYEMPVSIQMTHLGADTLRSAVNEMTKMGNHLQYIEREAYRLYSSTKDPIVKTFCEAVFDFLKSFKHYFSCLLAQFNELDVPIAKKVTILSISDIVSQKSFMLQFIVRCLNVCSIEQENKPQHVRLLNKLSEIQQELLPYSEEVVEQFLKIFKIVLRLYFKSVQNWFTMKKIPECMQFFIIDSPKASKLPENFLHLSDQIDNTKLPLLFEGESQGILQVGKTIRFISLYYENHEQEKLIQYFGVEKQFQPLINALDTAAFQTFKKVKADKPTMNERLKAKSKNIQKKQKIKEHPQDNPYQMFTQINDYFELEKIQKREKRQIEETDKTQKFPLSHGFCLRIRCILTQILENINKKCLRFFKQDQGVKLLSQNRIKQSVMHALMGIKKFMLLQKGDFLQQFFNSAQYILDKQKGLVSHNKIYSCIDQAINNSSGKHLPQEIISNVYFDFKKIPDKNTDNMRLWFIFCFWFKQSGPITYIYTSSMMEALRDISNFVFRLKKGQFNLIKIWDEDRDRKVRKNRGVIFSRSLAFRNALQAFFNSCLNHIFTNIDIIWGEYNKKIEDSSTVFEIVNESVKMIEDLEKLTTKNQVLSISTVNALNLLHKFQKFCIYLEDPTMIIHLSEIDRMDHELKEVVEIAMKIPELQEIMNYNHFYNRLE